MSKPKLMICDDNFIDRLFVKRILGKNIDIEISEAADAEKLYKALIDESYDILVLDSILPGVEGIDICKKLRSENYDFVIIFVSGKEYDKSLEEEALKAGVDYYLTKPVNSKELIEIVNAVINK